MFQNKIVNIIFSILVAVGLWIFVVGEVNPETTHKYTGVEVRFINAGLLANDGLALADPGKVTVDVTLSGKRSDMKALEAGDIRVMGDLDGLGEGENTLRLVVSLPDGIKLIKLSQSKLSIQIDKITSVELPVTLSYQGTIPEGKEPGAVAASPEVVVITGASSSVKSVRSLLATIPVSEISEAGNDFIVDLVPVDQQGNPIGYLNLSEKRASVRVAMLTLKTVPLEVPLDGSLPDGLHLVSSDVPDSVTIKGRPGALAQIQGLTAQPIDLAGLDSTATLPLEVVLPAGVELAAASSSLSATWTLAGEETRKFTYSKSDLSIIGLGTGLSVRIPDGEYLLSATATSNVAPGLVKGDFVLLLDLTGLDAGSHEIAVKVNTTGDVLGTSLLPGSVSVVITKD